MHIRILAVGDRQPSWVDDAFGNYTGRYPREWKFRLDALPTVHRKKNDKSRQAMDAEGDLILAKLNAAEQVVLLDERGTQFSSQELADRLAEWQADGRDLCFIIGGPDGVSDPVRQRADKLWSLSRLTLPHGMVRTLLAEQLYRAWSLQIGHPYHRV
ncbi:MAG: 23S rRNA (pseudouridine(1915)-N(3))-methyltransferase RlmH [Gammaproteobacteria bacterium]|nr:23S rRNA (pseudouridine(1915)-N(3))-methyltransferase RlmH [Gammaproteobacteria bacterium]MDH5239877.1 23S rRNA (pseudouridine(1915)-N(3))-methyltransferase RlmH [Gammaproteobacteria bacterium]MDH5260381.1 23S rRNA (pseudouridine(1915)-N(3))-methyltransferase RlmH [Gammaproteobacteria bacterium]MDH5584642.1 23S rRNA (pseudouridine(1915)-N(3))-methyltransferase RlmH [Gammaproteobacteria bacterium]